MIVSLLFPYLFAATLGLLILQRVRQAVRASEIGLRCIRAAIAVLLLSPAVVGHLHAPHVLPFIFWLGSLGLALFGFARAYTDTALVNLFVGAISFLAALLFETVAYQIKLRRKTLDGI